MCVCNAVHSTSAALFSKFLVIRFSSLISISPLHDDFRQCFKYIAHKSKQALMAQTYPPPPTHLYRAVQRAVFRITPRDGKGPRKHIAKTILRNMFRDPQLVSANAYSESRFQNTLLFLKGAAEYRGMERRVFLSTLHVGWARNYFTYKKCAVSYVGLCTSLLY